MTTEELAIGVGPRVGFEPAIRHLFGLIGPKINEKENVTFLLVHKPKQLVPYTIMKICNENTMKLSIKLDQSYRVAWQRLQLTDLK